MIKVLIIILSFLTFTNFSYSVEYKTWDDTKQKPDKLIDIPIYKQKYNLSCEIASLKSALESKGVDVSEEELMRQLPFDTIDLPIIDKDTAKIKFWGDPDKGFVGLMTGKMPETGYGVYEKPIHDLATKYRKAKIIKDAKIKDVVKEVSKGNPVLVWGSLKEGKDISWKTKSGKPIKAIEGEHVRLVVGFDGEKLKIENIYLLDPAKGRIQMTTAEFKKDWGYLDNKAVAIY